VVHAYISSMYVQFHSFIDIPSFFTIQSCGEAFLVGVFIEASEYIILKNNFAT